MATIHYSLSGEGRGHAARARVLVDLLKHRHDVTLHAYGAALDMLVPLYRDSTVRVLELPGMRFRYDKRGVLNRPGSLIGALPFLSKMPARARSLSKKLEKENVDLVIGDFEPLLPRAAELAGIPVMSVDHQQFLTSYDLSALPRQLQKKANTISPFVGLYYKKLVRSVISAFFFPPLKDDGRARPITQAGVLLRDEILQAESREGSHLVAYVRRRAPSNVLSSLRDCGLPVHVYGHGNLGRNGNMTFHDIDPSRFAEHLASSQALVTTAGNQVVGEALSLRKPVLAYPEPGNFEQHVNGHFLESSGQGWSREAHLFTPELLTNFTTRLPGLRDRIRPERMNGNRVTLAAVEYEIAAATRQDLIHTESPIRLARPALPRPGWSLVRESAE